MTSSTPTDSDAPEPAPRARSRPGGPGWLEGPTWVASVGVGAFGVVLCLNQFATQSAIDAMLPLCLFTVGVSMALNALRAVILDPAPRPWGRTSGPASGPIPRSRVRRDPVWRTMAAATVLLTALAGLVSVIFNWSPQSRIGVLILASAVLAATAATEILVPVAFEPPPDGSDRDGSASAVSTRAVSTRVVADWVFALICLWTAFEASRELGIGPFG